MKIEDGTYSKILPMYEDGKSASAISREIGISISSVLRHIHKSGAEVKKHYNKYEIDHKYFNKIDTEDKAYFLGFITADGFVNGNSLCIEINSKDREIIELFRQKAKSNHPIYERTRSHKSGNKSNMVSISISSKEITASLAAVGISRNKTFTIDWEIITANMPPDLIRHFIRGYFDGDGWFVRKRFTYGFVCGSEKFMRGLANYLSLLGCLANNYRKIDSNIFQISVNGRLKFLNFHKLIYNNCSCFLGRKHNMSMGIDYAETLARKTGPKSQHSLNV